MITSNIMTTEQKKQSIEFDITHDAYQDKCTLCFEKLLVFLSYFLFIITIPISIFFVLKIVNQYEKAVIFRLGRLRKGGVRGPGIFFVLPCIDVYINVDLRLIAIDIPPQEVLTKDSCTVNVTAIVYYTVTEPIKVVASVRDARRATLLLASTSLRNVVGLENLAQILTDRKRIAAKIEVFLEHAMQKWGVKVASVDIKDVSLPDNMQRAMAAEAEAYREARAKVINAEGELNSAIKLKQAAQVIAQNPIALQLRYLQTLTSVAADKNTTIAFPLPVKWQRSMFR